MSTRPNRRRITIEVERGGDLIVADPLDLVGKTVTVTITAAVVKESSIRSAAIAKNAGAEIEINASAVEISVVP